MIRGRLTGHSARGALFHKGRKVADVEDIEGHVVAVPPDGPEGLSDYLACYGVDDLGEEIDRRLREEGLPGVSIAAALSAVRRGWSLLSLPAELVERYEGQMATVPTVAEIIADLRARLLKAEAGTDGALLAKAEGDLAREHRLNAASAEAVLGRSRILEEAIATWGRIAADNPGNSYAGGFYAGLERARRILGGDWAEPEHPTTEERSKMRLKLKTDERGYACVVTEDGTVVEGVETIDVKVLESGEYDLQAGTATIRLAFPLEENEDTVGPLPSVADGEDFQVEELPAPGLNMTERLMTPRQLDRAEEIIRLERSLESGTWRVDGVQQVPELSEATLRDAVTRGAREILLGVGHPCFAAARILGKQPRENP